MLILLRTLLHKKYVLLKDNNWEMLEKKIQKATGNPSKTTEQFEIVRTLHLKGIA